MSSPTQNRGYILADLLVGLLLTAFVAQATMMTLASHTRSHRQQQISADLEQNLRIAMRTLSATLRATGYGSPTSNLQAWVPWVSGFDSNPTIDYGPPATISVARCTSLPVAFLTAGAARGSTTLDLVSNVPGESVSMILDDANKRLIYVGGREFAHITRVSNDKLTIDTDLNASGDQGLTQVYPSGTPVCRVDVLTFKVDSSISELQMDENHGDGFQPFAEDISNVAIQLIKANVRYEVSITALSMDTDPITGTKLTRTLRSDITLRNAL